MSGQGNGNPPGCNGYAGHRVGSDMARALQGHYNYDFRGRPIGISPIYLQDGGRCMNARLGYTGSDQISAQDFAQTKMQQGRQKKK